MSIVDEGVYATWHDHGIYVNRTIYGGYNNYDSSRSGLAGQAIGSTEGAEWSTFIICGYDFHFGHLTVGPVVSLQRGYRRIQRAGLARALTDPFGLRRVAAQRRRIQNALPVADWNDHYPAIPQGGLGK
jgi:hypothetical protein